MTACDLISAKKVFLSQIFIPRFQILIQEQRVPVNVKGSRGSVVWIGLKEAAVSPFWKVVFRRLDLSLFP